MDTGPLPGRLVSSLTYYISDTKTTDEPAVKNFCCLVHTCQTVLHGSRQQSLHNRQKKQVHLRHMVATPLQDPTYPINFQQIRHINYYMSVTFFVVVKSVKRC